MGNIAVVVPTIPERKEIYDKFLEHWTPLFEKHHPIYVEVIDGENPTANDKSIKEIMGKHGSSLSNFNAGIRNLGFAYVAKYHPDVKFIITLDDDCLPMGDPIQQHIKALESKVSTSWMNTMMMTDAGKNDDFPRGFPYGVREEAEVVLSHGVWWNVPDWDAPTQLNKPKGYQPSFYRGPVPKGALFPVCAMNMAFHVKLLPYIFQAPWFEGIRRFDDIFAGITAKRAIDENGWAAVTGYADIWHDRASNVFTNLKNEAPGIELNETYWQGNEDHEYFKIYKEKLETWQKYLKTLA